MSRLQADFNNPGRQAQAAARRNDPERRATLPVPAEPGVPAETVRGRQAREIRERRDEHLEDIERRRMLKRASGNDDPDDDRPRVWQRSADEEPSATNTDGQATDSGMPTQADDSSMACAG